MVQASVGFQCPECAHQRTQRVVTSRQMWSTGTSNLIATKVIIGLNVAAYFLMVAVGGSASASGSVYEDGALYGPLRRRTASGGGSSPAGSSTRT